MLGNINSKHLYCLCVSDEFEYPGTFGQLQLVVNEWLIHQGCTVPRTGEHDRFEREWSAGVVLEENTGEMEKKNERG